MLFITRHQAGERMTDLCRQFGISRKTGYKLLERFEHLGVAGLEDLPRTPHRLAKAKATVVRELFIEARKAHPTWGARKLLSLLQREQPGVALPAASTVSEWLERAGLVKKRRRKLRVSPMGDGLTAAHQPNDVWCVDYKGQFRLGNGAYCYPLTVTDQFSRYILACEGYERISGSDARFVFEKLFETQGLPTTIRSDNGSPFATRGLLGLSRLAVWWLKLGIRPERIEPGHPEQNGRHERMHRTLKAETTRPAGNTLLQQQERFDAFVDEFNQVRPHEALEQKRPCDVYTPSQRAFQHAPDLSYPFHDEVIEVETSGHARVLRRRGAKFYVSSALVGERLGARELDDGKFLLTFANIDLGVLDPTTNHFQATDLENEREAA
jgi:transposase InsO family protein